MSEKREMIELIQRMPEDCSVEDVMYELYVFQRIAAGLADARAGRLIPHEQVMQEVEGWLESHGR